MVFNWILSDSKFLQVSRTLLGILAELNNVIVWMVSTRPLISKFSNPFDYASVTVARASITIGINVTFMFHCFCFVFIFFFFQFSSKVQVLIFLFDFFQFYSVVSPDSKIHNFASSLFFYYKVW